MVPDTVESSMMLVWHALTHFGIQTLEDSPSIGRPINSFEFNQHLAGIALIRHGERNKDLIQRHYWWHMTC